MDKTEQLKEYLDAIDIIDAHEHFVPEENHLENDYNFFYWMIPYIQYDLESAGMPSKYIWNVPQTDQEIEECAKEFFKVWDYVKNGSYARVFLMALKEFYNIEDITPDNYLEIGKKMNQTRYPGRYKEILQDRCKIKYMLNQAGRFSYKEEYMKGAYQAVNKVNGEDIASFLKDNPKGTLDDYVHSIDLEIKNAVKEGAVLVKYDTTSFITSLDEKKAQEQFESIRKDGAKSFLYPCELSTYIFDKMLEMTKKAGIVAAVHTGVWFDITKKNPEILFPVLERYPDLDFDIYHMGMPYVRECAFLGKNYSNAYLNLCWSFAVSPKMAANALEEWIDLVPMNKIIGFGGDYITMPENIWAHLELAKETLAKVFSDKIKRGEIDTERAKEILKMWMYDNPARLYKLNQARK